MERNPKIHGSFTREVAIRFDELNMDCEQYTFEGSIRFHKKEPCRKIQKQRKMNRKPPLAPSHKEKLLKY